MRTERIAALLVIACALGWGAAAQAQEARGFTLGHESAWFLMGGAMGGGSFGSPGGGGFAGGELSLAWTRSGVWAGLYGDASYDFGHGATTLTLGPELGWLLLGLDGGLGVRLGRSDQAELGAQVRGLLTLGNVALFGRYGHWPGSARDKHVGQVGVLLKLPLWASQPVRPMAP